MNDSAGKGKTASLTLTEDDMSELWERMAQMYGHRWVSSYGAEDTDNVWRACLSGITFSQVKAGMRAVAMNGNAWPPTAPEFRKICEDATLVDYGLPDPDSAYMEAAKNSFSPSRADWSHAAVYVAGRETGWFDLRESSPGSLVSERFKRNYDIAVRRVLAGSNLNDAIPKALEDTRDRPRNLTENDKLAGRAALDALKAKFKYGDSE